jgi:hypothetical protein
MTRDDGNLLFRTYEEVLATLVGMINHPDTWVIEPKDRKNSDKVNRQPGVEIATK